MGEGTQMCAKRSTHWPDAFLRVRLCKPCRETKCVTPFPSSAALD